MSRIKLTKLQEDTLKFIGQHPFGRNFYWGGGTLLAYQYLGHRGSEDIDFFSNDLFSDNNYLIFINELKKETGADKIKMTFQQNRRLYLIKRGQESIKLELVYFPFIAIERRQIIKRFGLRADSLTDIMVNKILSAYQRSEPKDVYDIYYYLNNKPRYDLKKLIKLAEKKFGVNIEITLLLAKINELTGKLDALQPLLFKKQKDLTKTVKKFFQEIFNSVVKKQVK